MMLLSDFNQKTIQYEVDVIVFRIHVHCDNRGNVYAQRFCKSHVFCHTTQPESVVGAETSTQPTNKHQHPGLHLIKLEQGEVTKVFDCYAFEERLWKQIGGIDNEVIPPSLIFIFGQTWQQGFPISNHLVYMRVTPEFAREKYSVLIKKGHSIECDIAYLQRSMSSMSMPSH